ncbi:hypothetical protein VC_2243 [Vibrio cholerae O1 biovar El Tor str. N16961]|uniref:Uncharacterized protein n=2 Tax=Vibrio cholerae TaxID=666 RepID=Q9KPW9_VIBCH|nr:hypothetical protein VC_2243 [Vibrio cholerae O1 biovar El Tor str. N16961]ACP06467.1 conserved hypothetical protein [Vibrio cholerae M66-2]ACP10349.1 conserved hypothetical protein [Vibrio cholerae O395]
MLHKVEIEIVHKPQRVEKSGSSLPLEPRKAKGLT